MNTKKIGLFTIEGEIKNYQSSYRVSEDNPCPVKIPFDRIGEILSAYQRNSRFKVKSMTYGPSCLYVFTEPIHGGQFPNHLTSEISFAVFLIKDTAKSPQFFDKFKVFRYNINTTRFIRPERMTESKENLKKRIDTNKNQYIENNEVDNFAKDKKNGDIDLNNLGEYLNNLPLYNNDELKKALNNFFRSPERNKYDQTIKNKVTNNQPLDKTELSLMYLAMISEPNKHFTQQQLKFDSSKPVDQICDGALIGFIRTKYNYPTYTGKKVKIDLPNETKKKTNSPIDKIQESKRGDTKLPENIGEIKESEADFYCDRLITRAEKNFANDIEKAKRELEQKHRYKNEEEKKAYIKRDTLLIAFSKYTEAINSQHEKHISNSGYKDKTDFENQMKLIEEFGKEIERKYPNINNILEKIKKFDEEMKANEKKYFKNENETKEAEKNYKEFNEYMDKKSKEYNIDKIQESLKKEPKTKEEMEEYLQTMNKIFEFQEDLNKKNKTYGDSISKYQNYIKGAIDIQKKYNIQEYQEILEKYNQDITNWNKKIDFKKYENYKNGLDWKLEVGLKNINTLQGIIINPQNEYFPVKEIREVERKKQIKQDGIDRFRERLKKFSPGAYWTLTTFTGLWNGLIDATIGVSTSLGVMILGIIGGTDETLSQMDRKAHRDNFFKIGQSSSQKESVYDSETGFNFNSDNTVSTVASSISQMLTLIYGGGAIGSGASKVLGISENIAGRVGLFTSSFITQVGGSYQEAITHGLTGKNAIGYSFLSATIQSSLELVSPNDVLLGKGNGIAKELIRNACNEGGKQSFMLIGKTFLKNVGLEILEENIQEGLQTAAGNLINMVVNGTYGSELGADWSWKNFASTAIITALTTGITTGISTGAQMYEMSNQDQTKLIEHIKSDNGLYLEVTGMLDKAIEGKISIPNVSIDQLQNLKLSLTGNSNINTPSTNTNIQTDYEIKTSPEIEQISQILGSRFHEERKQSRLQSDGTYAPRIEKTSDQTWISQHNGQTEVDIANTPFEDLPSDWKSENLEAAKIAVGLVYDIVKKGEKVTSEMIEKMAEIVHNKRLERNGIEGSFENQRVPYEQLSEVEKEKDRNQLLQAIETVKENNQIDSTNQESHQSEITEDETNETNNKLERSDKQKVQEFIRKLYMEHKCTEPIEGIDTVIPYKDLLDMLIQSAEDEFERVKSSGVGVESEEYKDVLEIKNKLELFKKSKKEKLSDEEKKQIKNIAKDKRLYELPVYRQLIEKGGFILPSDVRDYYDSAGQASVYHLGIDYNVEAGTEVKAMYDGEVVWSGYTGEGKPGESSLGHKVIIKHKMPDGTEFYSLYGHLGKDGLISKGTPIHKGDIIGRVGKALTDENGNWQAHLHFQIMENEKSPKGYSKIEGEGNYDVLDSFGKDEGIQNLKNKDNSGDIELIKDIELTPEQINNIKTLKHELGIEITPNNIDSIKDTKLTSEQIDNIKTLKDFIGEDLEANLIEDIKDIKLTPEQINNIKTLKHEFGIESSYLSIEGIKDIKLTQEQINNIKTLKNELGIDVFYNNVEDIKDIKLTPEQINNIKILKNEIGIDINARLINLIKDTELTPEQIDNIKTLKDILGDNIEANSIEDIKDIKLTPEQINNIKTLKNEIGIDVLYDNIENIKDIKLTPEQINNINTLKNELGIEFQSGDITIILENYDIFKIDNNDYYKGYNYTENDIKAHNLCKRGKIIEEIQQYIQNFISENRDIRESEIQNQIHTKLITLPKADRLYFLRIVSDITKQFNTVRKYIDFENGPYKSPKELLCAIQGITDSKEISKITDNIKVKQYGIGLTFYVGKSPLNISYSKIVGGGSLGHLSSGVSINMFSEIPELTGTNVVRGSLFNNETTLHEGQHRRNLYFMPDHGLKSLNLAKDEITAYLRGGTGINIIKFNLTQPKRIGGLYQYELKGEARENHKTKVKELLSYADDLIKLSKNPKLGLTKEGIISMLSDTPADGRKDLHSTMMEAVKIQEKPSPEKVKYLKENFITKIKNRIENQHLIRNLTNRWNSIFSNYKIDLNTPEFRRAETEKKETEINEILKAENIEDVKHILNDPKYSHIGRGFDNKGGIEISTMIDEVIAGKTDIESIPEEIRNKIQTLITKGNNNNDYLNGEPNNEGLIFDSKYVTQQDVGIYRFNTKETTNTQKNKPGYQSLQEAEQSLNDQIGGKYDKKLYQESFTKKHQNEDFEEDVDDFIKYATEKELNHKQIFLDLAKEAFAKALFIGGPKKKDRIIEKVRNELLKEGEGLEALTDFTRATILFDNFSDFEEGLKVLEKMKNEGRILNLKIRNRLTRPGCNDIFVNIQTPDGYVSEVQFHIPEVLVFRDEKLGDLSIDRYKSDNNILDKHTLTKDIFDLSNDKYKRNLEAYNKIIDRLNEGRDKDHLLSLPKEQDQIVYDHDMYDIIRVLEVYENADNLTLEDYELFTSKGFKHENIKDLLNDLRLMKEHLCNEALNRYRKRTK